jgi:arsenite methyltransferase
VTGSALGTGSPSEIRTVVRARYGAIAESGGCCGASGGSCCGDPAGAAGTPARSGSGGSDSAPSCRTGYTPSELARLPRGADRGLGCGHPTSLSPIHRGEVVLDLGSGAGIDCFLASRAVGPRGRVIGVDMTPAMVDRARQSARSGRFRNVEFRLGEIEHLPVADRSVDRVISNCVVNLSPEKEAVFREAFRVLRPGGRLTISDMASTTPVGPRRGTDPDLWSGCSAGAIPLADLRALLRKVGFREVQVERRGRTGRHGGSGVRGPEVFPADVLAVRPSE